MTDTVFMAEMTWPEWQERIARAAPVFLPVGSTEQHGPHMALSCDVILPTAVCERVAKNVGGIVAPAIPYGYKSQVRSGGGQSFPGTTSLDANTLILVLRDVIRDLGLHGVRRLAVVNGHFENMWPIIEGIDLALRELRRDGIADMVVVRMDYGEMVHRSTLDRLFPEGFPGTELEHASLIETSLMLLVRPDLVHMDRIPSDGPGHFPPFDRYPDHVGKLPPSGVLAVAHGASAEKGAWLMEDHVALMTSAIREQLCA